MKGYIGMTDSAREVMPLKTRAHLDEGGLAELNLDIIRSYIDQGHVPVISSADFGAGFELLNDKTSLVGVPFYIVDYKFNGGPQGAFVTCFAVTHTNDRYIFNDGGSGIYRQMQKMNDLTKGEHTFIEVPKGLTRSDYKFTDDRGVERDATTFYLSQSR